MTSTLDLLVFAAHPDDAEIGMGGTMAKLSEAGKKVAICDLTLAEMSSNGTVSLRQREAALASEHLGITTRINLELPDRGIQLAPCHIDPIVKVIREHRPRLVAAPYWKDRHPDHIQTSKIVQEAVFNAKLRRYLPSLPAWTVPQLIFYFINDLDEPDFIVDVSSVHHRKMEALRAYRSQFTPSEKDAVDTPLTLGYLERVEMRDRLIGSKKSIQWAEGFVSKDPLLVQMPGEGIL